MRRSLFALALPLVACAAAPSPAPARPSPTSVAVAPAASIPHDDAVAELVLPAYDLARHRVAIEALPSRDGEQGFRVRGKTGNIDAHQPPSPNADPGAVLVTSKRGEAWAAGLELDWIVVGDEAGLCGDPKGFLALVRFEGAVASLVASAPWAGGCAGVGAEMRFVTAGGRKLILEAGTDAGEESPTEGDWTVWMLEGERLVDIGSARRSLEDTRETSAVNGFLRKMTTAVEGTDAGLHVRESWTFTPVAGGASRSKSVDYVLRIEGEKLVGVPPPEPKP